MSPLVVNTFVVLPCASNCHLVASVPGVTPKIISTIATYEDEAYSTTSPMIYVVLAL